MPAAANPELVLHASLLSDLANWQFLTNPVVLAMTAFQLWMFVDAVRREEWIWAAFIFIGFGLSALLYFFLVYRAAPSATRGFELPGAHDRRRIKELQAQIHHLDKPHHHSQLRCLFSAGQTGPGGGLLPRIAGAGSRRHRYPLPFGPMPVAEKETRRGTSVVGESLRRKAEA